MKMSWRKTAMSGLLTLTLAVVAPVSPAQASTLAPTLTFRTAGTVSALPTCDLGIWDYAYFSGPKGWMFLPIYNPTEDIDCLLASSNYNNWGVVALQNALVRCYGQSIAVDGDFGSGTRTALLNAQNWERVVNGKALAVDGVYGPATRGSIMWPYYTSSGNLAGPHKCMY
ncbi:hypothetical protein GCM10027290_04520 [Micromonospora sonneratiae]|uniref:Peptidoglycan-binding domain-containing protein n=1 Tax=Micromonospora sonneratiae TaxID=1184706 RepID=A0ABW3YHA4_9ACTN